MRLAPSHAAWPELGATEARAVAELLRDDAVAVEHVGSTSVPGLAAKPIIDLAVGLPDGDASRARRVVATLEASGYPYLGDMGTDGGLLLVRERDEQRSVHVHVVVHGDPRWHAFVDFRDLLRADAEARERYQRHKEVLAAQHEDDRDAYTTGKHELIRELLGHPEI